MGKVEQTNMPIDILCIGLPSWEGNYAKSTILLLSSLASIHRVLYVEYQFTIKDVLINLIKREPNVPVKRILGFENRFRKIPLRNNRCINVLTPPPVLPFYGIRNKRIHDWVLHINNKIIRRSVKKYLNKLNFNQPLFMNAFDPFYGSSNFGKFNEIGSLYYCYDDMATAPLLKNHGARLEADFINSVDVSIFTSSALLNNRGNDKSFLIENGVDFELFNQRAKKKTDREAPSNKRNIIGFVGSMDERIDYGLLKFAITNLSQIDFQFVGRIICDNEMKELDTFDNVELIDPVSYNRLPEVMSNFDIGIIPFTLSEFNKSIYPMKINEYLSLGLPVVSTNFSDLTQFEKVIDITESNSSFCEALKQTVADKDETNRKNRIKTAQGNSWLKRAQKLSQIISHNFS